jgi:hypothetical protein
MAFPFSMQVDETTKVSHCGHTLAFVTICMVMVLKKFLFHETLQATKAVHIFEMVKSFFNQITLAQRTILVFCAQTEHL